MQLNRDRVGSFTLASEGGYRDVALLGDCDEGVANICQHCGWTQDLDKLVHKKKKAPAAGATGARSREYRVKKSSEPIAFQTSIPASRSSTTKTTSPKQTTPQKTSNYKNSSSPYKK